MRRVTTRGVRRLTAAAVGVAVAWGLTLAPTSARVEAPGAAAAPGPSAVTISIGRGGAAHGYLNPDIALAQGGTLTVANNDGVAHTVTSDALGTSGDLGCLSFHETKNIISGEGGALILNNERLLDRAEIIREKGTDRSRFFRGQVDKYTWQDIGSSYCPGEIVSAFLMAQLEQADAICARRRAIYDLYRDLLAPLAADGTITLPRATGTEVNGHILWILLESETVRADLIRYLSGHNINAVFHYVPLHSAPAGRKFGRPSGDLAVTDGISNRLLRLPLYYTLDDNEIHRVAQAIFAYFGRPF